MQLLMNVPGLLTGMHHGKTKVCQWADSLSSSMSRLQMGATWGGCTAAEADVMTASQVSAQSTFHPGVRDFHPGVWGPVDVLHSQLGPIPGFKMVTMELLKRRKLRNC